MSRKNHDLHTHGREGYSDPSPYPEVKVLRPNPYYAQLLMDDYAGLVSEFTAISQYIYHHIFFKDIAEELGELLENVSIIEMHHMELLGGLIKKLGGNPTISGSYSTHGNFWNGCFVYYGLQLCDRLKADIDAEYKAIHGYENHISMIDDPHVKAILKRIILDEMIHIKHFNKALNKFCGCTYKPLD